MTKDDIKSHMDGRLALLMCDRIESGDPIPMTTEEIADFCGVSKATIMDIESKALRKLRLNPEAWEAVTSAYRAST